MINIYLLISNITSRMDPFEILSDTSLSNDAEIRNLFSSVSGVISVIGFSLTMLSLMANAIVYMLGKKNPEKMAEFKEMVGTKLLLVAALSCFTTLCAIAKMIADSFVNM